MKFLKASISILLAVSISQVCYAFSKPPSVQADTCPTETSIIQTGSTYTAPGGWTGVVQSKAGKVKIFDNVLYKPKDTQHPFKEGTLLRCSYQLDNGQFLDLRLPESSSKARIINSENWESIYAGHQYDCHKSRLACEFNLAK
ncbi:MAG: DUF3757 domain-containing protein [Pseudomonadota bacterium]